MKSLKESLFDDDLITKEMHIDVQTALNMCLDAISKKFHVKAYTDREFRNLRRPDKEASYLLWAGYYEDGVLDMAHIMFYNISTPNQSGILHMGIAASICISNEDDGVAISRLDVGHVIDGGSQSPNFAWDYCVWDGEMYKTKTKLRSPYFTSKNVNNIIKYIENVCDKVIKQSEIEKGDLSTERYMSEIVRKHPRSETERNFYL